MHAHPMHAGVHLDHYPQGRVGGMRGALELHHVYHAIDGHNRVGHGSHAQQPGDLGCADDLVGNENVSDTSLGHDLGLTGLGASDATGARGEQTLDQCRRF